jgi:hypothetical protein
VDQGTPDDVAAVDATTQPAGEEKIVFVEMLHDCRSRTGALENAEERLNSLTNAPVGIFDDVILGIVYVPDGKGHLEFSPARLIQNTATEPGP